jgi:hypothetical protein
MCGGLINSAIWHIGDYGTHYKYQFGDPSQVDENGFGVAYNIQAISAEEFNAFFYQYPGDGTNGPGGSGCGLLFYEC